MELTAASSDDGDAAGSEGLTKRNNGGGMDVGSEVDGNPDAEGKDDEKEENMYPTLLPPNRENMTNREVAWWVANYFVPFDEIESYSLEFSGMLGDLGLYIPIVVLLALNGQIDLGTTLVTTGLSNIITSFFFKVPMCVQPMKSIASVALTDNLTEGEIMAAGITTSAIVAFLGFTNLIKTFDMLTPKPVVRGLQIGLGLSMFKKGLLMLPDAVDPTWTSDSWIHWDGYLIAGLTLIFCLVTARSKSIPTAFVVFLVGIVIAATRMAENDIKWDPSLTAIHTVVPTRSEWLTGMYKGALPQVPTTLLNSCIAVCKLSEVLYPHRETNLSLRTVSSAVGSMNAVFCWFGGYPMCHGSGGLAGNHRFGSRTNLSSFVLGMCKLFVGAFFGTGLLGLLRYFPNGLLASLLAVASWELTVSGREGLKGSLEDARLCVMTAAFVTFWGQANGILLGLLLSYVLMVADAFFGTPEEIEKGRKRLDDNRQLTKEFFVEGAQWWRAKFCQALGREQVPDEDKEHIKELVGLQAADKEIKQV
jgi:MFS superfamily sulfate permease-like transporter